jgi:hypothetical protein
MLSPPSQPSTERQTGRDTPPPAGFTSLSATMAAEPGGRAARRARAPVNYAEPSLIAKMRRPTKELLDAVGRDGRPLRGAIVGRREVAAEWRPPAAPRGGDDDEGGAAEEPPSPLGGKSAAGRPGPEAGAVVCEAVARTAGNRRSAAAGAAAVKPVVRAPRPARGAPLAEARLPTALREEDLAIFDFTESSPSSESRVDAPRPGSSASSRRRSTMSEDKDGAPARGGGRSSSGARRRSTMV